MKMSSNNLRTLLFVTATIQLGSSTPVRNIPEDNGAIEKSKRVTRGVEEDPIAIDLENYVATIPIESFEGDYFLIQFLDVLNGVVTFRHIDPIRQVYTVYNTEYIEDKTPTQNVFVLRKYEDRIKVIKQKRTYVVLRRCIKTKKLFYVSLIYLKDVSGLPGVKTVLLGGQKFEVEWDIWDHRGGNEDKAQKFGQVSCTSSIFVPCHNNDTKGFQSNWYVSPKEKSDKLNFLAEKISSEGVDEDIDFFYDLDDDIQDSKFVGSRIDNLTRTDAQYKGAGRKGRACLLGFVGKLLGHVGKVVGLVGFGLPKSFGGAFGGLGTEAAKPRDVFSSLGFYNLEVFEDRTVDNVVNLFDESIKLPSSGGLGGFVNTDEEKEKEGNETVSAKDFLKENLGLTSAQDLAAQDITQKKPVTASAQDLAKELLDSISVQDFVKKPTKISGKKFGMIKPVAVSAKKIANELLELISAQTIAPEKPVTVSDQDFEKEGAGGDANGRGFLDFLPEKMKDPMPENVVEKVVQFVMMDNVDTFKHPGWKILGKKLEKGLTLTHEKDPFVGFGACDYLGMVTQDQVGSAKSAQALSKILQLATGTYCIKSKGTELSSLIKDGILQLSEHQSLQFSDNIPYIFDDKLNAENTTRLSQAYELAVFSEVYSAELNTPAKDFKAPDDSKISHSVYTLGKYIKSSLFSIRKSSFRSHSVKIRRNLIRTLKTFILKLLVDKIIIEDCNSCETDKEINFNDQIYLTGLSQFIMRGMGPVRNGVDIHNSFDEFFNRNKQVFEAKVKFYYV